MSSRTTGERSGDTAPESRPPESVRRLVCCRCDHRTHDERDLSTLVDDPCALASEVTSHDRVTEAVVLETCNRLEVYASTRTPVDRPAALECIRDALDGAERFNTRVGKDAFEHLCRVACGLESKVLGEDHVLGQVRRAFETATDEGLAGGILTRAADAAVRVGRTARAETGINDGHRSYGVAACEAIAETDDDPGLLVVVGAGEIAEGVAKAATHRWPAARIDIVNRSPAPELLDEFGDEYWPLSALASALEGADAVVTATGAPDPVLTTANASSLDPGTPVVDLANPPDVADAVRALGAYPVTTLSTMQSRIETATEHREEAVPAVEAEIECTVAQFCERERESAAEDTIRALHRQAQAITNRELEQARHQLREGETDPETVLENFASALTGSLLDDPTTQLRAAARDGEDDVIAATNRLFDLADETE